MVLPELLTRYLGRRSFFWPVFGSGLLEAILALHSFVLIEHVLRRRLVDHEALSRIFLIRALLMIHFVRVRLLLVKCMDYPGMLMHLLVVVAHECVAQYQVLLPLRKVSVVLVQVNCWWVCLLSCYRISSLFLARYLDGSTGTLWASLVGQVLLVQ